jgi:superfamily II DNA/RNA helicase
MSRPDQQPERGGGTGRRLSAAFGVESKRETAAGAPSSSSSLPRRRSGAAVAGAPRHDNDRTWKRSKSIEELEMSLTSRWGTDARPWTDYDDEDDEGVGGPNAALANSQESSSSSSSSPAEVRRVRPVWDPWEADEENQPSDSRLRSPRKQQKLLDSDLVKDGLAVGGKGTRQSEITTTGLAVKLGSSESSKPGYFFRPPSESVADATSDASVETPRSNRSTGKSASSSKALISPSSSVHESSGAASDPVRDAKQAAPRLAPPAASRALYDADDGVTPLFLTIQQAQRNFDKRQAERSGIDERDEERGVPSDGSGDAESSAPIESAAPSWNDLGVSSPILLDNLRRMGCDRPLAVQRRALEFLLSGTGEDSAADGKKDAIIGTMTGSGKTLSFLVPLAQRLIDAMDQERTEPQNQQQLHVLIVAPGRELASQIVSVARDLLQGTGLAVQLAIGGTTYARNLEGIRKQKPQIIVGTPGRLAELFVGRPGESKGRLAKIYKPQTLVLDEFDALLEYKPHREKTVALLNVLKRDPCLQTIVCSATASDMMVRDKPFTASRRPLIDEYLRPGYRVAMADSWDASTALVEGDGAIGTRVSRTVIHGVVHVPHQRYALETLRRILHTEPLPQQVLVFVKDARKVKIVVDRLERNGIIAAPLSGDDDKTDRADVSRALREGYVGLVVATELAARGLDAPLLTHVINMDLPTDASHYAHRAGRCGRGSRPGVVINLTTMPQERSVPKKLAENLGIDMYAVEVRNGKLNIVDPTSQLLDATEV